MTGKELCNRYMRTAQVLYKLGKHHQAKLYLAVAAHARWGPNPPRGFIS